MPTFVSAFAPFTPLMLPSTIELLCVTKASEPMAVALDRLGEPTSAFDPMIVFWLPVVFERPAKLPRNELPFAVLSNPALRPTKVLSLPAWFTLPAPHPRKELLPPLRVDWPAPQPKNELNLPVGFCEPASTPTTVLVLVPAESKMLNARSVPMLYWVVAFTTLAFIVLAVKVPRAVPSPLMLKFPTCADAGLI